LGDSRGDDEHPEGQGQRDLYGFGGLLYYGQHGVHPPTQPRHALRSLLHCHTGPLQ
ncbi:hypothetical protein M9458_039881, partial [Cirrhinus mrigala]